jgi:hypothetical protein
VATAFILLGGKRMSALGNYVHFTWSGYKKYGTKMPETWRTKTDEAKNYEGD